MPDNSMTTSHEYLPTFSWDRIYSFDSYRELAAFLANPIVNGENVLKELTPHMQSLVDQTAKNGLWVPYLEDKLLTLDKGIYDHVIELLTYERYERPYIWYRYVIGESHIQIRIYPLEEELARKSETATCLEILREIAEPELYLHDDLSKHDHLCEKEIETAAGKTLAFVEHNQGEDRFYTHYIQDGNLIILCEYDEGTITDEWLRSFELRRYQE
jgi:hypothetical protein